MSGILCTIWDDTSPHLEVISRGVFDFALLSWNYEDIPMTKAHTLFQQRFYSAALANASFNFQDTLELSTTPFWATAFLQEGDREVYHKTFTLISLPDPKNKGVWSKTYNEKLSKANVVRGQQTEIAKQLSKAQEVTRRNEYALSLFNVINEFQTYTSDVLLLLKQYDQSSEKDQKVKALQIKKILEDFPAIRSRFEEAYGKTRIMGNPPGYQLDSNFHHHLANGTNTSDWIFIYEIAMNKKVSDWLTQLKL
jgi:hexosaminidase